MTTRAHLHLIALIALITLASGCGRMATPVVVQQYGDEQKSCATLGEEMMILHQGIEEHSTELERTTFWQSVTEQERDQVLQTELTAMKSRHAYLTGLAEKGACAITSHTTTEAPQHVAGPETSAPASPSSSTPESSDTPHQPEQRRILIPY
ncbi:MAG: hypothetical protein HQL50_03500 [Magnetococcales bacterium]|nr:hypothetical protein [Magnetococcales bacterium]